MIKLLVTDLDGTFLSPSHQPGKRISDENKESLRRFREQGGIFVTCSGRHHEFSYELMEELGFAFDCIGINGCTIIHKDALVEHNHPPRQHVRKVVEELTRDTYKGKIEIVANDIRGTFIFGDPNSWAANHFKKMTDKKIIETPLFQYINDRHNPDVTSIHVNVKDPESLHDWISRLRIMFDQHFDIYASGPINIEFMKPGINKGHGVRSIMKLYGLQEHEVAVCGDNQNDISMFFAVKHSYCMSTATPQVQKYAKKIVKTVSEALDDIVEMNELEMISKQL